MNPNSSVSMKTCLSKAVLLNVPDDHMRLLQSIYPADPVPSRVTFQVSHVNVISPQTGHPWYIEMEHDMKNMRAYSLVPVQENTNRYVHHYREISELPRLLHDPEFSDAWITSHHRVHQTPRYEIHFSQNLYCPTSYGDRLYFPSEPRNQVEVLIPGRFIEDQEFFHLLRSLGELEIRRLSEHRS